jgi:hypothetical protein
MNIHARQVLDAVRRVSHAIAEVDERIQITLDASGVTVHPTLSSGDVRAWEHVRAEGADRAATSCTVDRRQLVAALRAHGREDIELCIANDRLILDGRNLQLAVPSRLAEPREMPAQPDDGDEVYADLAEAICTVAHASAGVVRPTLHGVFLTPSGVWASNGHWVALVRSGRYEGAPAQRIGSPVELAAFLRTHVNLRMVKHKDRVVFVAGRERCILSGGVVCDLATHAAPPAGMPDATQFFPAPGDSPDTRVSVKPALLREDLRRLRKVAAASTAPATDKFAVQLQSRNGKLWVELAYPGREGARATVCHEPIMGGEPFVFGVDLRYLLATLEDRDDDGVAEITFRRPSERCKWNHLTVEGAHPLRRVDLVLERVLV